MIQFCPCLWGSFWVSIFFNSYLQFPSSLLAFHLPKFLPLLAFLVMVLLLSLFVCGLYWGVKGCHEAVSLATWAPSGQPWRNHISIFPHPAGEGCRVGEAFRKQQSYRYLQGPAQRCQESHCPTCWVLRIFPGTSPPGEHLCNLPSHPKAPSRRQVSHKQASSSPAFSLFSPEKVTLCPGWHLSFDGKTQSPLRVTAINHRVCCSLFFLKCSVFSTSALLCPLRSSSDFEYILHGYDLSSFTVFALTFPWFSRFSTYLMAELQAARCFFWRINNVGTNTQADPVMWTARLFSFWDFFPPHFSYSF